MATAKNKWISNKIGRIMKEGVRGNTMRPVSKSNPRKPVSRNRAIAIAESMYRRRNK